MNLNREPIKNWFGFTRRERRSTFIMLLIIILIIGLRYTIPESRIAIEDISDTVSAEENHSDHLSKNNTSHEKPFSPDSDTRGKFRKPSYIKKSVPQKTRIDINMSDSATLVKLPGIGPVLSARIIKYRHLLGGFARIDQLKEVYGLPVETYELIKGRIFADSSAVTRININSAGYKELSHLPYFEKYEVTAILKFRELKGRITKITDLTENKLITEEKARKISPYLKFET
jgi:DNA uptake protein ComE-like DNA-binding protein